MSDRSVGSFAISYHFGTRTTYTLCHRLQNRYKGRFLRRVKACAASGFHPYLLPLILARLSTEQFDEHISEMRADFLSIQKTMGTNVYFLPEDVDESPDLTEMPRKLTAIANAVAVTAGKTQQIIRGIDYLGVQLRGFEHRHGDGKEDKVVAQMKDELAMTQSRLAASAYISDWLAQSVQAHVQMAGNPMLYLHPQLTNTQSGVRPPCAEGQPAQPPVWGGYADHCSCYPPLSSWHLCSHAAQRKFLGFRARQPRCGRL